MVLSISHHVPALDLLRQLDLYNRVTAAARAERLSPTQLPEATVATIAREFGVDIGAARNVARTLGQEFDAAAAVVALSKKSGTPPDLTSSPAGVRALWVDEVRSHEALKKADRKDAFNASADALWDRTLKISLRTTNDPQLARWFIDEGDVECKASYFDYPDRGRLEITYPGADRASLLLTVSPARSANGYSASMQAELTWKDGTTIRASIGAHDEEACWTRETSTKALPMNEVTAAFGQHGAFRPAKPTSVNMAALIHDAEKLLPAEVVDLFRGNT